MTVNNYYLTKIVAASLLGDATINKDDSGNRNRNGNFRIKQLDIHKDHLEYLAERLEQLTRISWFFYKYRDKMVNGKQSCQNPYWMIKSMNHPFYTKFRERMYGTGKKAVDPHYLTLLDAEFLAIWYMQDGFLRRNSTRGTHTAEICSDNFTYGDHELLRVALKEKLNLNWSITHKNINKEGLRTYRLTLNRKEFDMFVEKVKPFIQPSFEYKINPSHVKPHPMGEDMIRTV